MTNNVELLKKLTVLIVEDEETSELLLTEILQPLVNKLYYAKDGEESIKFATQNSDIDLILMDLKIPKISGYEATRQIKEINKDITIIAQTAYALPGDKEKALSYGCNDYITKPIDKEKLINIIINNIK